MNTTVMRIRYILCPLHAAGLSQNVGPTSVWGPCAVTRCIQRAQDILSPVMRLLEHCNFEHMYLFNSQRRWVIML